MANGGGAVCGPITALANEGTEGIGGIGGGPSGVELMADGGGPRLNGVGGGGRATPPRGIDDGEGTIGGAGLGYTDSRGWYMLAVDVTSVGAAGGIDRSSFLDC